MRKSTEGTVLAGKESKDVGKGVINKWEAAASSGSLQEMNKLDRSQKS